MVSVSKDGTALVRYMAMMVRRTGYLNSLLGIMALWRMSYMLGFSYSFYLKHARRYREPSSGLVGGVDVNTDHINLAVINDGRLGAVKTF